jgi:hypothetical protein
MLAAPVATAVPGRMGGSGFRLPSQGTVQQSGQPGFVPGLAVPGLAWPAGPGGT